MKSTFEERIDNSKAGEYWDSLTPDQRVEKLMEWEIPQAFIAVSPAWKDMDIDTKRDWFDNYVDIDL